MALAPQPRVLREYAFIADGERGAVVRPDAGIVWLCVPAWNSPAVFAALLGWRVGYIITPTDPHYVGGGYYESGSLIGRSRWVSRSVAECREALALPAEPHRCVILRPVEAIVGAAVVKVALDLRAGFGKYPMANIKRERGSWTARSAPIRMPWMGASRARIDGDGCLTMTLCLGAGQHHDLVLEVRSAALMPHEAGKTST